MGLFSDKLENDNKALLKQITELTNERDAYKRVNPISLFTSFALEISDGRD
jgi:hypothetical protein